MGYKVLIAEDDFKIQKDIKKMIISLDNENTVTTTNQAEKAIKWIEVEDFDIFYVDIQLANNQTGWDLIKNITRTHPGYPVIIISGVATEPDIINAFNEQSILMYINKPYTEDDIAQSFEKAKLSLKYLPNQFISFKADGINKRFKEADIYYVKRHHRVQQKAIIRAYDARSERIIETEVSLRGTITKIAEKFRRKKTLIRCHQSYLVNPRHIVEYNYRDEELSLSDGTKVPVGAKYFRDIKQYV